jgi:hypothetical protein
MKPGYVVAAVIAVLVIAAGIYFVDIEQTEEASLPDVDVTVEGGNMPEVSADVGDVEVGSEEVTITVPTVDVQSPEEDRQDAASN